MPRFAVFLTTWANTSVEIDVPDGVTDPEEIAALAVQENDPPTLCHHCTGGGRRGRQELEIGDDWEPGRFNGAPTVTPLD